MNLPALISKQAPVLNDMVVAYLAAVAFTDFGEGEQPPAGSDFAEEAVFEAYEVCAGFLREHKDWIDLCIENHDYTYERAGHDLWLTRNGHGAGFWDRGLDTKVTLKQRPAFGQTEMEVGDALSDAAKLLGSRSCYLDESDDLVYFDLG